MNRRRVMLAAMAGLLGLASFTVAAEPKVVICHLGNTMEVDESALDTHLSNHDDSLGACDSSPSE